MVLLRTWRKAEALLNRNSISPGRKTSQGEGCGNITGLAQTPGDTINHRLRDPYYLWHSHLQLTTLICPSHYSTIILNYKQHNGSCCSSFPPHMLTRKRKKKKKDKADSFLKAESLYTFSCMVAIFCIFFQMRKMTKNVLLLLASLPSSPILTIYNFLKENTWLSCWGK